MADTSWIFTVRLSNWLLNWTVPNTLNRKGKPVMHEELRIFKVKVSISSVSPIQIFCKTYGVCQAIDIAIHERMK